jgi:DNA-binding NarL/FixJ family response regulator
MPEDRQRGGNGSIGVLIWDDVDAIRALLGVIIDLRPGLRLLGEANDGEQAIVEAERLQPDVILLDLAMPRLTGLEALPHIQRVAPAARVIVLSGFTTRTLAADALALGAIRYIEKGADPDTIADAIEEVAGSRTGHVA